MSKSVHSEPKVAIITRTKNRPWFLERAVRSVIEQTERSYQHVILNDGGDSSDVERILARHPDPNRIVIHNSVSVGLARALNQAIKASSGDYICILDDDDAWSADRLEKGLAVMKERDAYASVVPMETVIEDTDDSGNIVEISRTPHPESWCGEVSLFKQAHRNYLSNGAVMYRRSVYEELGGYDETLPTSEDWDFGIRLMLRYNVEQVLSDNALVFYHQRPNVQDANLGNSVHAGVREQERAIMLIRNNYLRSDLQKGVLGVGYIMNQQEQDSINVTRVEAHINRTGERIEKTIIAKVHEDIVHQHRVNSLYEKVKRKIRRPR